MVAEATVAASGIIRSSWVVVLLPVVSALLTLFFGKRTPGKGAVYGIVAMGAAFVMSLLILWHFVQGGGTYASGVSWFTVGSLHVEVGQYVDGLTAVMLVVVTAVSLCVHVYSLGYMDGDVRFTWFYVVLSLFTAAMLNVVIAPNLIQLLVGWEIMGVCSYLLIGHWYEDKENSNAAIKAFITTRIGDVPFMFGIFALIFATGFTTSNITAISGLVASHQVSSGLVAAAALAAVRRHHRQVRAVPAPRVAPRRHGRPDARLGADPRGHDGGGRRLPGRADVRGLHQRRRLGAAGRGHRRGDHHARCRADGARPGRHQAGARVLHGVPARLHGRRHVLGPAGRNAAFFHLFTHAFFKALLFLGAGSVIHAVHSNDMSDMGGLREPMPVTFWTFLIGSAALAGIAPLAGFWSKDELLVTASDGHGLLFAVMLVTAALTAFYTTRMVVLTFFGTYEGRRTSARVAAQHGRPARLPGGRHDHRRVPRRASAARAVLQVGLLRRA